MPTVEEILGQVDDSHEVIYFISENARHAEAVVHGHMMVAPVELTEEQVRRGAAVALHLIAKHSGVSTSIATATKDTFWASKDVVALVYALYNSCLYDALVQGLSLTDLLSVFELAYARRCAKKDISYLPIGDLVS